MTIWQVIGERIADWARPHMATLRRVVRGLMAVQAGLAALLGVLVLRDRPWGWKRLAWLCAVIAAMFAAMWALSGCTIIMSPLVSTTREYHFYGPVDGASVVIEKQAKAAGGFAK